jgi:hypothetical protein
MSLESTAVLAASLLHDGTRDGSSSEETPSSPHLSLLDALVVSITLGYLAFLVMRLASGALFLYRCLVPVENRLLQERRLGRNKVGALQLQRQESVKISRGGRALRRSTS